MKIDELVNRVFNDPYFNAAIVYLDKERVLKLKSLIITYLIMMRTDAFVFELTQYLVPIIESDEVRKSNYIHLVVEFIFNHFNEPDLVEEIVHNYIFDGYLVHSFNAAFSDSIEERGLILKDKPWDLNEIEMIKGIFAKRGKKDIFGLYQGEERTPIFLAENLNSSAYYGISSPTWFLHFCTGGLYGKKDEYDKEAFRNRDYDACLTNVITLCEAYALSDDERYIVLDFFEKYYAILGTNDPPKVLLIERKKLIGEQELMPQMEHESDYDYICRTLTIFASGNRMIRKDIKPEDILIIDYKQKERVINL